MGTLLNRRRYMGGGLAEIDSQLVATFNVTSTSASTKLMFNTSILSKVDSLWIDGVKQPSVVAAYTFPTTGEHVVEYKLVDKATIPESMFRSCGELLSLTVQNGVLYSQTYILYQSGLKTLVLSEGFLEYGNNSGAKPEGTLYFPDSLTSLGYMTFSDATALTSVRIGPNISFIDQYAFIRCSSLSSVTIEATTPPTFGGNGVFNNTSANLKIYVPAESVETYKNVTELVYVKTKIEAIPT